MTEILRRGAFVFIALSFLLTIVASIPVGAEIAKTCKDLPEFSKNYEGNQSGDWGSINFKQDNRPLKLNVNEGYKVNLCVKKGSTQNGNGPVVHPDSPFIGEIVNKKISYPGQKDPKEGFSHYSYTYMKVEDDSKYYFKFLKEWQGDKIDLSEVKVTFYIGDDEYDVGERIKVEPGQKLKPLSEEVTGLPENCRYKSDLPNKFKIPEDPKKVTKLTVTNTVKCRDVPVPEYEFQFEKEWEGDDIDLEGVEVTFFIGETPWKIGDDPVEVQPGDVLEPLSEEVTGLPENCTYESDLPESYTVPNDEVINGFRLLDDDMEDDSTLYTLEVTNTVECEDDPVTPVTPEGETETPVTPASSTATTQQVTATPVGAVDAGAGSALTALVGLFGSTGLVSVGAFLRRFSL